MLYISSMNNLEYIMQVFDGTYIDDRGWQHFRVEGKTYDIRFHPNTLEWECSCPAYKFKRGNKTCKHIKQKQEGKK